MIQLNAAGVYKELDPSPANQVVVVVVEVAVVWEEGKIGLN